MDGYTYIGPSISIQLAENSYFNAYQNAGIIANQAVDAFDLIYSSPKLQNQFLGKDSPLSEDSKSTLFNALVRRENDELGFKVGQTFLTAESIISGAGAASAIAQLGSKLLLRYAANKAGTVALKSFTKGNFRYNLGQLSGKVPANSQAHHVFPQKYLGKFNAKGINIHDPKYGVWWETSGHLKNAKSYNATWEKFIRTSPSKSEMMNYGRQLMKKYGIPVGF